MSGICVCEHPHGRLAGSRFHEMDVKEHVTLLPSYLGKVGEGVTELLTSRVLLYHSVYGGVLLSFSCVRVLQSTGRIVDELPHIHIDIAYTATVFKPQVGEVMCGSVNRVGVDHIGCLLYNCFNACITCSATAATSTGRDCCSGRTLRSWCSRSFDVGEDIWFRVSGVEVTGWLLSLRGEYLGEEGEHGVEGEVGEGGEEGGHGVEGEVDEGGEEGEHGVEGEVGEEGEHREEGEVGEGGEEVTVNGVTSSDDVESHSRSKVKQRRRKKHRKRERDSSSSEPHKKKKMKINKSTVE